MKNILLIDDDKDFRLLMKHQLKVNDFIPFDCADGDAALDILSREAIDLVLCDLNLGKRNGKDVLTRLRTDFPSIPVIIITGYNNIRSAVELMRSGAADYLVKPLVPSDLAVAINRLLANPPAREAIKENAPATSVQKKNIVFSKGEASQKVLSDIEKVAPTNFSVILYGESGTGKEAFARQIHERSARNKGHFLAIDCGALPPELSASILFGHEKGAFTGALLAKEGALEAASGGTVFLDEINNLPYPVQVSLLRVLQEKKIRRVGGTKDIPIDVRVIVASNSKLWEICRQGSFREDLYHRLNEFAIDIKPLRERSEEILFYADHFLQQSCRELGKPARSFSSDAWNAIMQYRWPGNLRELRNVVRRGVLLAPGDQVGLSVLPDELKKESSPSIRVRIEDGIIAGGHNNSGSTLRRNEAWHSTKKLNHQNNFEKTNA